MLELDRWSGESIRARIGNDLLNLGGFWHDRADAVQGGSIAGANGAITWTISQGRAESDLGGDPSVADAAHFVRIVAEGLQGRQDISFSSSAIPAEGGWQVTDLSVQVELAEASDISRTITGFNGGVEWAGATGARNAEISTVGSAWQSTINSYQFEANGDGLWGHGDYWLNLGSLSDGSLDLSNANTLDIQSIVSAPGVPFTVYVRDADRGWSDLGSHLGEDIQIDLTGLADTSLDQLNALVLRINESDLTDSPDQTATTRVFLNDIFYTLPGTVDLAGDVTIHDLGDHSEGTLSFAQLPGLTGGEILWFGQAVGGEASLRDGVQVSFQTDRGHDGPASFDYVVRNNDQVLSRHRAVVDVQAEPRWSNAYDEVGAEDTVVIGAGERVLLDQDARVGTLIIDGGELIAEDRQDISLTADRVLVMDGGLFQVGRADNLFSHNFTLVLTGDDAGYDLDLTPYANCDVEVSHNDDGPCVATGDPVCKCMSELADNDAYLMAMGMGSMIEIHAADADKAGWTQLDMTGEAGSVWLTLAEATSWEAGDRIVIASTDFNHENTEERTIVETRNGGVEIRLDRALDHRHYGEIEDYQNGKTGADARSWQIDMRAEVALLSRNVTITGDEDAHVDGFGGHIMVMHHGDMRIQGAEITRMGQEGILGRYGAHWHLSGDATGDYLKNNSFHEIYNKGITWHGVQNTVVSDNVVYGTIGHSYFMEDGAEFGNTITGNLGLGTKAADRASALTSADIDHVSTYWIENANNVIEDNHAAGSDFAGFWIAPSDPHGLSGASGLYDDLTSRTDPIQHFVGNTAHSNSFNLGIEGHVADGGQFPQFHETIYEATGDWEIRDFTAFKSDERSIWTRTEGGTFTDIKSADNVKAAFFSFNNTMTDSVVVGRSEGNNQVGEDVGPHRGHSIYDGPSGIENVHFANFSGSDYAIQGANAAEKSTTHFAKGITFGGVTEANKVDFSVPEFTVDGQPTFFDDAWTTSLIDLDGSITGIAGATITAMIDGPDGTKINTGTDAIARTEWNAWVSVGTDIGWMRISPSHDDSAAEMIATGDRTTWYDIVRSDGAEIMNARPTNDMTINAAFAAEEDLVHRVRLHELPESMVVGFRGLAEGAIFHHVFENLPSETRVFGAAEVSSRAALDAATSNAFYRDNNDLVFKFVAERQVHRMPNTDDAEILDRTFGTNVKIETGLANDSANVLADYESGIDTRGATSAVSATIGPVRTAWNDRPAAINWWDVTANGDGTWGYGDYHLNLGETQNWTAFSTLDIDTIFGRLKPGFEVLLNDAEDGLVSAGRFEQGQLRVYLDTIDNAFLDQVDSVVIRIHEQDLTDDVHAAGAHARVHLHSIMLDANEGPRFDFAEIGETVTVNRGNSVFQFQTQNQSGAGGVNALEIAANGDGVQGFGSMSLSINNEDWRAKDWLKVSTSFQGLEPGYSLHLRDSQDGWTRVGNGDAGDSYFDLSEIDPRYLDQVHRVLLRIDEADLSADLGERSAETRMQLEVIDLVAGRVTLADFEDGIDPRGRTTVQDASISAVRAAWQDRDDSINYWDVAANGDGKWGHGDYRLTFDAIQDLSPFSKLTLDTALGGVKSDFEVILQDADDGYVHLGKFGEGVSRIYLDDVDARYLDDVSSVLIRVHESDLTESADDAGPFTRIHLKGVYVDSGPRFDFEHGVEPSTGARAEQATISAVRHDPDVNGDGALTWQVAANGDGRWGHGDLTFRINQEDWRDESWLNVNTVITGNVANYSLYLRDSDDGWVALGQGSDGLQQFALDQIDERFLDQVDTILLRVDERDLANDEHTTSAPIELALTAIDLSDKFVFDLMDARG